VKLKFLKSPVFFSAAPVILAVCFLELAQVGAFQRMEWMTYDWRVRLAHRFGRSSAHDAPNLGWVEISDLTIAAVDSGEFPFAYGLYWPREVYARGLYELSREGAKCVAFDVLFPDLRPDHPKIWLPDGSAEVSSDEYFAHQLKASGNAILPTDRDVLPHPLFFTNASIVGNISVAKDADDVLRRDRVFEDIRDWDPLVQQAAREYDFDLDRTIIGSNKITFVRQRGAETVEFPTDDRGTIDTTTFGGKKLPVGVPPRILPFHVFRAWSLGIRMAAMELQLDLDKAEILPRRVILHGPQGLRRVIPVDADGYYYVDWTVAQGDPNLAEGSFEELLRAPMERANGNTVTNYWTNKLVLIGSTATGNDLADWGATPLGNHAFLCTKHLNVANSVITGRFIKTTPLGVKLLLILLVGAVSAWITWGVAKPAHGSLLMLAFAAAYVSAAAALFVEFRLWAPIVLPMVCAGFVTHLSAVTYRVRVEQSERKRVKQVFSRLVSPDVVNEVLEAAHLRVAGVQREITIYFADIRGFTEFTDVAQAHAIEYVQRFKLSPAEADAYYDAQAAETLNTVSTYLGTIARCVKQHKGTLDKFIGDCVMAFWGAPLSNPHHAVDAVRSAVDSQLAIAELNSQRQAKNQLITQENSARARQGKPTLPYLAILSMGSGINTGIATAGLMGSDETIVNYTVFGREVNLAARLEGVSGHSRIIIGEATYAAIKRDDPELAKTCVELPAQKVKGFRNAIQVYEVLWQPAGAAPTTAEGTDYQERDPLLGLAAPEGPLRQQEGQTERISKETL
jgi:class 3 adenylate cyclase